MAFYFGGGPTSLLCVLINGKKFLLFLGCDLYAEHTGYFPLHAKISIIIIIFTWYIMILFVLEKNKQFLFAGILDI